MTSAPPAVTIVTWWTLGALGGRARRPQVEAAGDLGDHWLLDPAATPSADRVVAAPGAAMRTAPVAQGPPE